MVTHLTGHKHSGLVVVPITKSKAKKVTKLTADEPNDVDMEDNANYTRNDFEKDIFHKVAQITKIADKEQKVNFLQQKLNLLKQKKRSHKVNLGDDVVDVEKMPQHASTTSALAKVLSATSLKELHKSNEEESNGEEDKENLNNVLETSQTNKHLRGVNAKQQGLSLLSNPDKYQDTTQTTKPVHHVETTQGVSREHIFLFSLLHVLPFFFTTRFTGLMFLLSMQNVSAFLTYDLIVSDANMWYREESFARNKGECNLAFIFRELFFQTMYKFCINNSSKI